MTRLRKVQEAVVQYAKIMAEVVQVDVVIVDTDFFRIAGTGIFEHEINTYVGGTAFVFDYVIHNKKQMIIDQPGSHELCSKCPNQGNCSESYEISAPIMMGREVIGVIGLACLTQEQKEHIKKKQSTYLEFLRQIADMIAAKVMEQEEKERNRELNLILQEMVNQVDQSVLVLGVNNNILTANKAARKQLQLEEEDELQKEIVAIQETGDSVNHLREYLLTIRNHKYTVLGSLYDMKNCSDTASSMLLFSDIRVLQNQLYEYSQKAKAYSEEGIIGSSAITRDLTKNIKKIAKSNTTVLITGESGTGKEVVAKAIWKESDRADKPFVVIHCASIPDATMECELFGYVAGTLSGADPSGCMGQFELADNGVIFLDDISDLPLHLQGKLLRVLQEHRITRVGSNQSIPINVRIIAASNRNLHEMMEKKAFREDLYYRLNVIPLHVAPLRERKEEIEEFVLYFIHKYCRLQEKKFKYMDPEVMKLLKRYDWPGNVRELQNVVEFMVSMMENDGLIERYNLNLDLWSITAGMEDQYVHTIRELEEKEIQKAIWIYGDSTEGKRRIAQKLGIGMATLYRKLDTYKIGSVNTDGMGEYENVSGR
ncbi:sigma-54 interaction domain-containing protein [Anaerocolumna sp. MB42-C2]|uniref:sigma-54 interaction domain-containing protein n=1 Tax=Anaerocolumna sp. MB42-C2 TaxID=3070997 RepID=UPI0027DFC179|nr:sigma 54-interacting transcriptional regulator [Anaerocolumna sp. MB42-C2]WMJ90324.1 sigma 54-interacting transcriptional regulator [Anaerocolumna sp. MB42-C2]